MTYIDGYVAAAKTANRDRYIAYATEAAQVFKQNGALQVVECWGEEVPDGKLTSFPMAVKLEPDETVVFSWIIWPSKEVRNAGMAKVMADPRFDPKTNPMPFDGKRVIFGGFDPVVEV